VALERCKARQLNPSAEDRLAMRSYTVKAEPRLEEAEGMVSESLLKSRFTLLVADCRVEYIGRSSSKLGWGERLIVIKPDRSVLIHRKVGYEAINWQPPRCYITVSMLGGHLLIRVDRRAPRETLNVICRSIILAASFSLVDEASFEMPLTEEELYRVLVENPHMIEPGFRVSSQQKVFKTGLADITGYDGEGNYVIVEVKRIPADTRAVKQLYKYVSEVKKTSPRARGIVAAPAINPAARRLARSLSLEYRRIDLKRCADVLRSLSQAGEKLDRHL